MVGQRDLEARRFSSLEELGRAAAEFISRRAEAAVQRRGVFSLALAGGGTPRLLYEQMAELPFSKRIPWPLTHLFWGDERAVPPDHPSSNFAMAFRTLISKVQIPWQNVHRVPGERQPPGRAARAYEEELRKHFGALGLAWPAFDLILLGLGDDGHTASLFPGDAALEEQRDWVAAVGPRGSPPVSRITLTLPAINRARCVLFLISGAGKSSVVRAILENPDEAAEAYPAARVNPSGSLHWWIDAGSVAGRRNRGGGRQGTSNGIQGSVDQDIPLDGKDGGRAG